MGEPSPLVENASFPESIRVANSAFQDASSSGDLEGSPPSSPSLDVTDDSPSALRSRFDSNDSILTTPKGRSRAETNDSNASHRSLRSRLPTRIPRKMSFSELSTIADSIATAAHNVAMSNQQTDEAAEELVIGHWKSDILRKEEDAIADRTTAVPARPKSKTAASSRGMSTQGTRTTTKGTRITVAAPEEKHSRRAERITRMKYALDHVGMAIVGSAATTIGCACFLLPCEIVVFHRIGAVVVGVTFYALFYTLVPMSAILMTIGPISRDHEYEWEVFSWLAQNLSHWFARGVHPTTLLDDEDAHPNKTWEERMHEFVEAEEKMRKLGHTAFDDSILHGRKKIETREQIEQRVAEMARRYVLHMPNRQMSARSAPETDPQVVRTQIKASG